MSKVDQQIKTRKSIREDQYESKKPKALSKRAKRSLKRDFDYDEAKQGFDGLLPWSSTLINHEGRDNG